jgi:MerR family copper efflux transcriptional regulator
VPKSLGTADLIPIDQVARAIGLRASAIRYYEQRGLVAPAAQHAGRRWYHHSDIRRLATISYWQRSALMSLNEIGQILSGPTADERWPHVVTARIDALREQEQRLAQAREYLEHVLSHHRATPDGCPHFEALIPIADQRST